jgi:hypothetical protein
MARIEDKPPASAVPASGKRKLKITVRKVSGASFVKSLKSKIRTYERRYELSSERMREAVRAGYRPETREISQWLQYDQILTMLAGTDDNRAAH